jgi:hypothetical protein
VIIRLLRPGCTDWVVLEAVTCGTVDALGADATRAWTTSTGSLGVNRPAVVSGQIPFSTQLGEVFARPAP